MDELGKFTLLQVFFIVIVPAIISGIPALVSALIQRKPKPKDKLDEKEQDASAADKVATAYDKVVEDLQLRIDRMEARQEKTEKDWDARQKEWVERQQKMEAKIERQGRRIRLLERGVYQLINQIEELGAVPVFNIPEEDIKENNT